MNKKTIAVARHIIGMSSAKLGENVGVSQQSITRIETGTLRLTASMEQKIRAVFHEHGLSDDVFDVLDEAVRVMMARLNSAKRRAGGQ